MEWFGTQNLNNNQFVNLVVHRGTSLPVSPVFGQLFYNLTDDSLYVCIDETTPAWHNLTNLYPVESGTISIFTGLLSAIPSGWQLCDGTNGTPNLLDKFVKNISISEEVGETGGSTATHTHDVLSAHTHTISSLSTTSVSNFGDGAGSGSGSWTSNPPPHIHSITGSPFVSDNSNPATGTTDASGMLPLYVTGAYIMRMP